VLQPLWLSEALDEEDSEPLELPEEELVPEPVEETLRVERMVGRVAVGDPDSELVLQPEEDTEVDSLKDTDAEPELL
jgi:hypothetical protein